MRKEGAAERSDQLAAKPRAKEKWRSHPGAPVWALQEFRPEAEAAELAD
jgi:hypothetical protein